MSNKPCISFQIQFKGDGTSVSVSIGMVTDPIVFTTGASNNVLSPLFNAAASGVSGLSEQSGQLTVSTFTWNALTKTLNVTFTTAPVSGAVYTLLGVLEF